MKNLFFKSIAGLCCFTLGFTPSTYIQKCNTKAEHIQLNPYTEQYEANTKYKTNFMHITSMNHNFKIHLAKGQDWDQQKDFPLIYISNPIENPENTRWINVITTKKWIFSHMVFDYLPAPKIPYPFYNPEMNGFFDAPNCLHAPLYSVADSMTFHTYLVRINNNQQILECLGGIQWGWKLKPFSLTPKIAKPKSINNDTFKHDIQKLKSRHNSMIIHPHADFIVHNDAVSCAKTYAELFLFPISSYPEHIIPILKQSTSGQLMYPMYDTLDKMRYYMIWYPIVKLSYLNKLKAEL